LITEDQTEVIEFLASPSTRAGAEVERVETDASVVFLAATRALKLKRAVQYDYLDFSTAERRRAMSEAEVRINRRTAPGLYRGVVAVTREPDDSLALGGPGAPIDWVIDMARFDQEGLFDRLAGRGHLALELMCPLATAIARFHQAAERRPDHGGRAGMAWVIEGNAAGLVEEGAQILDPAICARVSNDSRRALEYHGVQLDARRQGGFVRQCHGDLHLRNIVLVDGRPTLFDAIEFNDEIACIDVLYDLAFLLMDLWRRELPRHANAILNDYLAETTDFEGLSLLPLFLSCRAAVRAKTSATSARLQSDEKRRTELEQLSRDYLELARRLLQPPAACLIAIGGLSGSGKSTLALALGPLIGDVPGAVVIRSDEVRKQLCGVPPLAPLGAEGYTSDVSRRVYATLVDRAGMIVRGGRSAIVDAVFARPSDREAIAQVAALAAVPFAGLWLDAPESALVERAERRQHDASDANVDVIRMQVAQDTGLIPWHRLDASLNAEAVLQQAVSILETHVEHRMRSAV
jgi:aminoglycoside phosphotransferase family enzyme/predicted kinase